ncbi:helix-turn-helix domain-containing protein [Mucilaginibacter agri]|uniref:Helix-turn-helix domain-containing protein n=1 Tax=Mucilaginibacter agri TaxID=2695265 RepID=A0A965ZH81_9SPHI|nr:helix-turn-helix domain-containing protein [Mucilaginibacter agri]NCD70032.1 helix-turn-helix domain-containing protein [Mucilaginibacter agri]
MEESQATEKVPFEFKISPTEFAQFKVATISEGKCSLSSYNRRDYYKISFVTNGRSQLLYANRGIQIDQPVLVFTNPMIPYSWDADETYTDEMSGYFCVFTEEFLNDSARPGNLQQSSLFKPDGNPVYFLNDEQVSYLTSIFSRMRHEIDSEYVYKYDLLRSQVNLIIHEAIKMQPAIAYFSPQNAASRIAKLFINLLERQFPVDSPRFALKLKKAGDYADRLSVHVNHLNAAVQESTGKSTTTHINEKIIAEAKSLLMHTDWSAAEIAFSLGFEYASYFNNFFKKHTGLTPMTLRKSL